MPNFYILIGLPGCGKSTYAAEIAPKAYRYSTDAYIETRAAELGQTYKQVFDTPGEFNRAIDHAEAGLQTALIEGRSVIYDQTNMSAKKRRRVIEKTKQFLKENDIPIDYRFVALNIGTRTFHTDASWDKMRQERRAIGRDVPDNVYENMRRSYEPPKMSEGFDKIYDLKKD